MTTSAGPRLVTHVLLAALLTLPALAETSRKDPDRDAILKTLHSIFQAFVDQDRDTLRATHSSDWVGFKAGGDEVLRGIDAYMKDVSFRYPMTSYEIEEAEVQQFGDTAIVYYVAHYDVSIPEDDGVVTMRIRSVDVFRKEGNDWLQVGSNLNVIPRPGSIQKVVCSEECYEVEFTPN